MTPNSCAEIQCDATAGGDEPNGRADRGKSQRRRQDDAPDALRIGAKRESDRDLLRAARHEKRHHRIDTARRDEQRDEAEGGDHGRREARVGGELGVLRVDRAHAHERAAGDRAHGGENVRGAGVGVDAGDEGGGRVFIRELHVSDEDARARYIGCLIDGQGTADSDDAKAFNPALSHPFEAKVRSDSDPRRPVRAREAFIDDDVSGPGRRIEGGARDDRHPYGLEVGRVTNHRVHLHRFRRQRAIVDRHAAPRSRLRHWRKRVHIGDGVTPGNARSRSRMLLVSGLSSIPEPPAGQATTVTRWSASNPLSIPSFAAYVRR